MIITDWLIGPSLEYLSQLELMRSPAPMTLTRGGAGRRFRPSCYIPARYWMRH